MSAASFCESISTVAAECDQRMTQYYNLEQVENETATISSGGTDEEYEISYQNIFCAPFEIQTERLRIQVTR
jgi:hypothetical protein